ncbi:hypothetical protein KIPB_000800 [Kipferlia bialata]|uniref:Uncharacterized protein n=1 Tax=Kipferlia bialata TaxID=797122 RepID=A0A391NTR1_9EUKA|nr:hypothetical protein KIPB_000800 [Kipferlia bialata]|eukprot:g800.t1
MGAGPKHGCRVPNIFAFLVLFLTLASVWGSYTPEISVTGLPTTPLATVEYTVSVAMDVGTVSVPMMLPVLVSYTHSLGTSTYELYPAVEDNYTAVEGPVTLPYEGKYTVSVSAGGVDLSSLLASTSVVAELAVVDLSFSTLYFDAQVTAGNQVDTHFELKTSTGDHLGAPSIRWTGCGWSHTTSPSEFTLTAGFEKCYVALPTTACTYSAQVMWGAVDVDSPKSVVVLAGAVDSAKSSAMAHAVSPLDSASDASTGVAVGNDVVVTFIPRDRWVM